jgi:osmotically-inducible protein OsmY
VLLALCLAPVAAFGQATGGQTAADSTLAAEVRRALSRESELRRLEVTASGSEVTLSGRLPSLWHKQDAIARALDVDGVETVVSNIELPRLESDQNLALLVRRAIDGYPHYTMFDYIDGVIRDGVVTLSGSVTADSRNKAEELAEDIARVRGVVDIRSNITTLPPSQGDDDIRASLYQRIFSNIHFDQLSDANTTFHIVVHNGVVSLYGYVQSDIEYRELESMARFTNGVLRVNNNLQTITGRK